MQAVITEAVSTNEATIISPSRFSPELKKLLATNAPTEAYTPAKIAVIPLRDTNLEDFSINSFISFTDSNALFLSI